MTKTFCDLCRKQMPDGIVAAKLRIDNLLHDFCDEIGRASCRERV